MSYGPKRRNREEWRRRVERWRRSGISAARFAAQEGVNVQTLYSWRYRLKREQSSAGEIQARAAALVPIVELRAGGHSEGAGDARFEVELGDGRVLRVPSTFDAEALRRLLVVLTEAAA